jgi:uncharacterized HhH-GPD family protein
MQGDLHVTGDPELDRVVNTEPLALLLGMMLDQQVPMEWAFRAPQRLKELLGGSLDAATIAAMPVDDLEALFRQRPSLHRFPGSMARRAHQLSAHLVEQYDGNAARLWDEAGSGAELARRLQELPGFGREKAQIFAAVLAKRFGVRPEGWEEAAGPFADLSPRSVADIDSRESFTRVREWKKAQKAKARTKTD